MSQFQGSSLTATFRTLFVTQIVYRPIIVLNFNENPLLVNRPMSSD